MSEVERATPSLSLQVSAVGKGPRLVSSSRYPSYTNHHVRRNEVPEEQLRYGYC